jgi:hypothetical protein
MHAVVLHPMHILVSAAADFAQVPVPHILVDRLPCSGDLRPLMIAQAPGRPVFCQLRVIKEANPCCLGLSQT